MAILFIDLKSAYNNVRLEKIFQILRQQVILINIEVDFLQYSIIYNISTPMKIKKKFLLFILGLMLILE